MGKLESWLLAAVVAGLAAGAAAAETRGIEVHLKASDSTTAPVAETVRLYAASHALVIGIDRYSNGWPRLSKAVADAKAVAAALEKQGFQVTLKTDLGSDALDRVFREFFVVKGADPRARLLVWYAGHGHTEAGEGYLIPADAPRPDAGAAFKLKALAMRRFGEYVRQAESKHALAIFDSCFAGTIFESQRALPPAAVTRATTLPVRQFLTSGDSDQAVSDDGTFRELFLRAIHGEERADANGDGYLTGSELGMYLTDRLTNLSQSRQTPRYGKLRDKDYDRGDFVFALPGGASAAPPPGPGPGAGADKEALFWQSIQGSTRASDYEAYLGQYPNGTFAGLARNRIAEMKGPEVALLVPPRPEPALDAMDREMVAGRKATVRAAPDAKAKVLATLKAGDRVQVTGRVRGSDWYAVSRKGQASGYVAIDSLEDPDAYRARKEREEAANPPPATGGAEGGEELFLKAKAASTRGDHGEAMRRYREAAELGSGKAMNNIGVLYSHGLGVAADQDEALRWFRKAADLGIHHGMHNVGNAYADGLGVAPDFAEAMHWFRKAADLGNAQAMDRIGRLFVNGQGVASDPAQAMRWFRKAADLGNSRAMNNIGLLYQNGWGVPTDLGEAMRWYRQAADLGDAQAMNAIGLLYNNGQGVAADQGMAMSWYRKAADLGDPQAMNNIGRLYVGGEGVATDHTEAMRWFRKAADLGNGTAAAGIAKLYYHGWGVAADKAEAARWYRKAADFGEADAMFLLGGCYLNGEGVAKNPFEAKRWFEKAAGLGNADAMFLMAALYNDGVGVTKSAPEARRWLEKAAAVGHRPAKEWLATH